MWDLFVSIPDLCLLPKRHAGHTQLYVLNRGYVTQEIRYEEITHKLDVHSFQLAYALYMFLETQAFSDF